MWHFQTRRIKALTYLHDKFGTILYYPDLEKLSKRVIVNVKLIMKLPAEMIRTAFLKKDQGMQKTGVVTKKFINTIYSSSDLYQTIILYKAAANWIVRNCN